MSEYAARIDDLLVWVDKVGGGTVGKAYDERWSVSVKNGSVYVYDAEELITRMPKTHAEVAQLAADWASETI